MTAKRQTKKLPNWYVDELEEISIVMERFRPQLKCYDCEFCFGDICAGEYYGKHLTDEDLEKPMCEGPDISLSTYSQLCEVIENELIEQGYTLKKR